MICLYLSRRDPVQLLDAAVRHVHGCVYPCDTMVDGLFTSEIELTERIERESNA